MNFFINRSGANRRLRNQPRLTLSWLVKMTLAVVATLPMVGYADCGPDFPEEGVLSDQMEHEDIVSRVYSLDEIFEKGRELFDAKANKCDGQGRPATTGDGRKRIPDEAAFIRTSAPDANSCSGCHAQPFVGGAGDFVANVFVLAQTKDPVITSIDSEFSNERNTLGMHGSGPIEMLAREMTADLQWQVVGLSDGHHVLETKGVEFDVWIENGEVVESRGINTDLVVRPFHQVGVVVSLREFSVNAMNHHHGLQAEERFDNNPTNNFDNDFDEDGVTRELTVGDITALTMFQAMLGTPQQVLPEDRHERRNVENGEALFEEVGCAGCHKPIMRLENRHFVEPNPYNPPGTFFDPYATVAFDMTQEGDGPRLERDRWGGAIIRPYTDLKRHNLCDAADMPGAIRFYCNENLTQGRPSDSGGDGTEYFLTRKLWDVGSSAPYGHRGDLSTITEAILYHGGEARESRDSFAALSREEQSNIVAFLKTLQVVEDVNSQDRETGHGGGRHRAESSNWENHSGQNNHRGGYHY